MSMVISKSDPAFDLWQRVSVDKVKMVLPSLRVVPVPAGKIAQDLGIEVVSKTMLSDVSGSIRCTNGAFVITVNNTDVPVRQRFTVAHEIAHFLLHRDVIDEDGIEDTILFRSKLSDRIEAEANRLAASILLPWDTVLAWCQSEFGCSPLPQMIDIISKKFKVSRYSVAYRFGF